MRLLARRAAAPALLAAFVVVITILPSPVSGQHEARSGTVVRFGEDVRIDHDVLGDVHVLFGSATIAANVAGDVIALGGDVTLLPGASVRGEILAVGGDLKGAATHRLPAQARISLAAMNDPRSAVGYALKLILLAGWVVAAVVLVLVNAREVRATAVELRASVWHTFAMGLVAFTSFVLTAVVFSYLVPFLVGLPLLVVLGIVALATKIFGMVAVFHAVGTLVAAPRTREAIASRRYLRGDLAMVLVGAVILGAVRMIPVVGNIVWMAASLFGIGAALATRFGRREPWFLAWAPVVERTQ
jgi:hypothetical protein